jgi:hypothetical protein
MLMVVSIIAVAVTMNVANKINIALTEVDKITTKRSEMYRLIFELKQYTDDLTNFARLYTENSHPRYLNYYKKTLSYRDGLIEKPESYTSMYWDNNVTKEWPIEIKDFEDNSFYDSLYNDTTIIYAPFRSYLERVELSHFNEEEINLIYQAYDTAAILNSIEEYTFKISKEENIFYLSESYDGKLEVPDNIDYLNVYDVISLVRINPFTGKQEIIETTVAKENNTLIAKSLLYDEYYLTKKSEVMIPLNRVKNLVDQRTNTRIDLYKKESAVYVRHTYISSVVSLSLLIFLSILFLIAKRNNHNLIYTLNKNKTYLEHAAKILRHDMHSGINIYIPRGVESLKRRLSREDIDKLKIGPPIEMISEGLKHTRKVYKGVYEFTNLVKKDAVMHKEVHNIGEVIKEYLSHTSYKSQVLIYDGLPSIEINESLFCTAIDNLIRNGLKYNDSAKKIVKIYFDKNSIYVEDNGRGMAQKDFDHLSKPYTRREGQKEQGMGLGLNICKSILDEHGFTISVEKVVTGGTKIKIHIV